MDVNLRKFPMRGTEQTLTEVSFVLVAYCKKILYFAAYGPVY